MTEKALREASSAIDVLGESLVKDMSEFPCASRKRGVPGVTQVTCSSGSWRGGPRVQILGLSVYQR